MKRRKVYWVLYAVSFFAFQNEVILMGGQAAKTLSQQGASRRDQSKVGIKINKKLCEGTYVKENVGEQVLSVICPNLDNDCNCEESKIECGGTTKNAKEGYKLRMRSCKTTLFVEEH